MQQVHAVDSPNQRAHVPQPDLVTRLQIDAAGETGTDVLTCLDEVAAAGDRGPRQSEEPVPDNQRAVGRVTRRQTLRQGHRSREGADGLVETDLPEVDAARQTRNGLRRKQQPERVRLRLLRLQQRISALHLAQLPGDGLRNGAVVESRGEGCRLGCRHRVQALRQGDPRLHRRSARIVAELDQAQQLRVIQLDDARSADRSLVRAAEAQILDRRPLQVEFVGVHPAAHRVVRMAESGAEHQVLGKGLVLQQRCAQLDEFLIHGEAVVDRHGRAAESRQLSGLLDGIGCELHILVAMLEPDVHPEAFVRCGQLDPVLTELAGDVRVGGAQRGAARPGAV